MDQNERFHWNVVIKMAQAGNEEMLENLESENRWRKENNLPSVEEELGLVAVTPKKETAKEEKVKENEMSPEEIFHWKVVILLARSGDPEKQHELDCENRLRNDFDLPPIEDVLGDEIVAEKKKRIFTKEEALERAKKYHIEKDVLWAIDQEGYTPNEAIDEWELYDEEDFVLTYKEEMVTLVWSEGWKPVWVTRPKKDYIDDPLFLELQKDEPDDDLIRELQSEPKYQLDEDYIMEMLNIENREWAACISEDIRIWNDETNGKLCSLIIVDEDWGEMDEKDAEENLRALRRPQDEGFFQEWDYTF